MPDRQSQNRSPNSRKHVNTFNEVKPVPRAVESEPTCSQAYGRISIFVSIGLSRCVLHQSPDLRMGGMYVDLLSLISKSVCFLTEPLTVHLDSKFSKKKPGSRLTSEECKKTEKTVFKIFHLSSFLPSKRQSFLKERVS